MTKRCLVTCNIFSHCRQVASVFLIILSNILQTDLPEEKMPRSTCNLEVLSASSCILNSTSPVHPLEHPQDMTNVMLVYMFVATAVFLYMAFGFNPECKRSNADINNQICYKALEPVGCFQSRLSIPAVEKPNTLDNTNYLQTVETTYRTADLYSTYLHSSESDDST